MKRFAQYETKFSKRIIVIRDQLQCDDSVMINVVRGRRD